MSITFEDNDCVNLIQRQVLFDVVYKNKAYTVSIKEQEGWENVTVYNNLGRNITDTEVCCTLVEFIKKTLLEKKE